MSRLAVLSVLSVLLCGVVSCCAEKPPAAPSGHVELAASLAQKTVALVEEGRSYCTGTWVSPTEILTAAHCVEDRRPGDEVFYSVRSDVERGADGDEYLAHWRRSRLSRRDADHDLALLSAEQNVQHGWAQLSLAEPVPGEAVFTMGQPVGLWWSFSSGEISAVRYWAKHADIAARYVQATAPISPGSSGGGLFDASGRLIGVTRGVITDSGHYGQALNLFIHRDHIADFLGVRA